MIELTEWDVEKYKRQIQLPGFGEEAQQVLKNSSVLVTRIGGLGGPTAFWLAAAGVGKIVIAHGSELTPSNLNRQILMRGDGVGKPRAPQGKETLERFNPDIEVVAYAEDASEDNAEAWVSDVDLVCNCSPKFEERFILNRECWRQGKPLIDSAMNDMEATLTSIVPPDTPCLQCFVPEVPEWWDHLGFGVLGAHSGSLGALTAIEAVKVLTGFGKPLTGTLLVYDTEDMTFGKHKLYKRPECPVCGSGDA